MFKFIWQKRQTNLKAFEKVKRDVMCKPIEEGGLGMISVKHQQKSFLVKWVTKLALEPDLPVTQTTSKQILDESGYFIT